jgi:hypothetical protein
MSNHNQTMTSTRPNMLESTSRSTHNNIHLVLKNHSTSSLAAMLSVKLKQRKRLDFPGFKKSSFYHYCRIYPKIHFSAKFHPFYITTFPSCRFQIGSYPPIPLIPLPTLLEHQITNTNRANPAIKRLTISITALTFLLPLIPPHRPTSSTPMSDWASTPSSSGLLSSIVVSPLPSHHEARFLEFK